MFRHLRAARLAAAALAFVASSGWSAPLWASSADAAPIASAYLAHAVVGSGLSDTGLSDLGLNDSSLAQVPAASAALSVHMSASVAPIEAAPRALDDLIAELGAADVANAEQDCLANAVYFEARGEPVEGQLAVAEVVLNRTQSGRYPPTVCGVVTQRAQFSFVRRGVIPRADRASGAWRRAVAVARIAVDGARRLLPANVLWYHANYVTPSWCRRLARNTRIGLHIFYS